VHIPANGSRCATKYTDRAYNRPTCRLWLYEF